MSTSQPPSKPKTKSAARGIAAGAQSARPGVAAPTARRRAKRRQAMSLRMQRFETTLPSLRMEPWRAPSVPMNAFGFTPLVWSKAVSLLMLAGVLFVLIWINGDERWYVYPERVQVTGARLLKWRAAGRERRRQRLECLLAAPGRGARPDS